MHLDLPLLLVSAVGVVVLGVLLWGWKRYTDLWKRYADDRAEHDRQMADLLVDHEQRVKDARVQSVRQSRSGLLGNAAEQIAPMVPAFCERYSPSDARFLGAPIDYVIFDGLHRGEVDRVVFLEIKSGVNSGLNGNERAVRRAVLDGRVTFDVLSLAPARASHEAAT